MNIGLREHRSASLRVAIAEGLPEHMHELTRELISLKSGNQGKGHARALMWEVCTEADKWWVTLIAQPKQFAEGMPDEKLRGFYERFGFVVFQAEPLLMARSPQLPVVTRFHS